MDISAPIYELADRCVKCGLCLAECPTYNLLGTESESPRGRIALVQGWLSGQLETTANWQSHLDHCLLCRRCERVCPSRVPYAEIMDRSKALLAKQQPQHSALQGQLLQQLTRPGAGWLFTAARLLQKTGLLWLAQKLRLDNLLGVQDLLAMLPELKAPFSPKRFYPVQGKPRGSVALFQGCLSQQVNAETLQAAIRLLNRLGFDVHIPPQQNCCGAFALHAGNEQEAAQLASANIAAFKPLDIDAIISLDNGCSAQLTEYTKWRDGENFSVPVTDILPFLARLDWPQEPLFRPLNKAVALQVPCSLRNVLRHDAELLTLLQKIPGIHLPQEAIYTRCCGAAGSYFLENPVISGQFRENAVNSLTQSHPELIISSNLGCALQLQAGLRGKNNKIPVIHPILLLEQQLSDS